MRIEYKGTRLQQVIRDADNIDFVYLDQEELDNLREEAIDESLYDTGAESWFRIKDSDIVFYLE